MAQAEWHSRRAVRLEPKDPTAWEVRAEVLQANHQAESALRAIRYSLELSPGPGRGLAWLLKARLCTNPVQANEGLQACDAALRATASSGQPSERLRPEIVRERARLLRLRDG